MAIQNDLLHLLLENPTTNLDVFTFASWVFEKNLKQPKKHVRERLENQRGVQWQGEPRRAHKGGVHVRGRDWESRVQVLWSPRRGIHKAKEESPKIWRLFIGVICRFQAQQKLVDRQPQQAEFPIGCGGLLRETELFNTVNVFIQAYPHIRAV